MHPTVEDLIINMFFIVIPLLLYQVFNFNHIQHNKAHKLFIFGSSSVVLLLCMIFPIELNNGFIFDLRQVPLIIAFLYGGYKVGLGIYIILIFIRFLLGGQGFVGAFVDNTLLLIILLCIKNIYTGSKIQKKLVILFLLSTLNFLITISLFFVLEGLNFFKAFIALEAKIYFAKLGTIFLIAYFIEMIRKNILLSEQIKHTEKSVIVSQLAASISHEVRNPLTVSRGFIQLLKEDNIPASKKSQFFNLVINEIDRAIAIITDYLTFAKPSEDKLELLMLDRELEHVIEMITPMANMQSVIIKKELLCKENENVLGDRQRFHQSMLNLLKNSVEAMPNGGVLFVTLSSQKSQVTITIEDNGIGMSTTQLKNLGKPYFSSKETGTGLGMMVVYSIIESMKGTIQVKSSVGTGTTFIIQLPKAVNSYTEIA
ncbi:ATP-binding protein [Bacillus timonensis]|nr:ATP-binding protein [Bacillus timonensis]